MASNILLIEWCRLTSVGDAAAVELENLDPKKHL